MRTSDKLEKCCNSVVLLCLICRNLHQTKSIRRQHSFFVFTWRKLLLNRTDYVDKFMVNVLQRKISVNDGFGVSKVVTSTKQDKKEDKEHGKSPKNSKMWNYKHCWTKMIGKLKDNSLSNWALFNKCFQSPTRDGKDSEDW